MIFQKNGSTIQIIEKNSLQLVNGLGAGGIGIVLAAIGLSTQLLLFIAVGIFFTIFGIFIVRYFETRTTTITSEGAITIEYERMIGDKRWIRRLDRTDIRSLDYLKGFDGGHNVSEQRWCTIYLNVIFDEQIEIANRFWYGWNINRFGFPAPKRNIPLDTEANEIGNLLGLAVNTISYIKVRDTLNSVYVPRDKMAPIMQRPSQEQLDNERNTKSISYPVQ